MADGLNLEETADGITLSVKVVPGGSRDAVVGPLGGALKIKARAAAEGGKANRAVCRMLAKALGVSGRDVSVVSGETRPQKRIAVRGIDVKTAKARLPM